MTNGVQGACHFFKALFLKYFVVFMVWQWKEGLQFQQPNGK
jgi:hypothetical protein